MEDDECEDGEWVDANGVPQPTPGPREKLQTTVGTDFTLILISFMHIRCVSGHLECKFAVLYVKLLFLVSCNADKIIQTFKKQKSELMYRIEVIIIIIPYIFLVTTKITIFFFWKLS